MVAATPSIAYCPAGARSTNIVFSLTHHKSGACIDASPGCLICFCHHHRRLVPWGKLPSLPHLQAPLSTYIMPSDPTLYLYTSLTAGSSHIITATSRIETILKANKIPFRAVDCATDDKARMLWQRRSKGRKIPGLVKFNDVIAVRSHH